MTEPKNLDEALAAFQADPPTLVKDKAGQAGNQKTRYADLVQVNKSVLARLNELGIIWICAPTLLEDGKFALEYELRHVKSQTSRTGRYPLKLSENPQHMGSAITYARRYALLSLTGVAAEDEDDDARGQFGRPVAQRAARPQPADGQPVAQRRSAPPLPGENSGLITKPQMAKMQALFSERGISDREEKLAYARKVIGREIGSATELTVQEAAQVINELDLPDDTDRAEGGEGR